MKVTDEMVLAVLKHKYGADLVPTQRMRDKMQDLLQYALRLMPADWQVMTLRDEISMLENRIAFRDAEALEQAEEISELKAALDAMPQQEPVGYANRESIAYLAEGGDSGILVTPEQSETRCVPLYTHPQPQREPLSLSDALVLLVKIPIPKKADTEFLVSMVRAVEKAHGIGVEE